ncbi:MAG: MobV family relaxase [Bacilli bacterium]|nr:MobV family relaxase [Bacilli bacterium]
MSYAIFRVEPINKLSDLAQIGSHNKREKKAYKSNPDIDISKTKNNIEIVPLSDKYIKGFYELTKEYKKEHDKRMETMRDDRRRTFKQMVDDSNNVVADELLFTSDFDFFKDMSKKQLRKWADTCMEFVYEDLGYKKEQILHATVHMDEKTPHLHCVVVPIVRKFDKRANTEKWTISKKQYIKDKAHLSQLQDKYYERLINNNFDLERGIKNSDNEHISIKEFKKITKKLDNRLEKQNYLMTRDFEELEKKLKTSKPTITGKEVKIDKDTYDTLNNFMNTSKRVIKEMPNNQALFQELTDYTSSYKELENEKRNIQYEVNQLKCKNNQLQKENRKLRNFLNVILQSLKQFFHKLLRIGNEQDKDNVVNEITGYYEGDLYTSNDLHDITDDTSKEEEINDYLYNKNYEYDDKDIDI